MKKRSLSVIVFMLCLCAAVVTAQKSTTLTAKQEKREVREKRRADKQAAFEKMVDSLVLGKTFQFNPQTMMQLPAGSTRMLQNPNFNVGYWNGTIDVFLPYFKGYTPPYNPVILNYTLPSVSDYITEQTDDGWRISFNTTMFSASTFTFVLEVSSRYGGATLTVNNTWYNSVRYVGSISQLY